MASLSPRFLVVNRATSPLQTCIRCQSRPLQTCVQRSRLEFSRPFSLQPALRSQGHLVPGRNFNYHIASAFTAKNKPYIPPKNLFNFYPGDEIPPPKRPRWKRPASGQDAFFISHVGGTNAVAFGVADGVGGWEESGVDPADFSHRLCEYMASAADNNVVDTGGLPLTARALMQRGYDDVCKDNSIHAGGSTASVAVANDDGTFEVANLGDSGFVQLRLNAVHSYSEPQTHAFNTPYQLSIIPASMLARAAVFGGAQLCDHPKDADVTQHKVKHGDILIFATDGVWDNLFNQDILRLASRLMIRTGAWITTDDGIRVADDLETLTTVKSPTRYEGFSATLQAALAMEIASAAKTASINQRLDGPFAKEVQKYYPQENWHGGKVDDICVIVAIVTEGGKSPEISSLL
ncbi:protein serine/threonine phosphatase 2C [Biscogniauxia mediterranea]|nr:protein serine/threonine phosphatase 2C [Biscogniauxia mediterranea]